MTRQAAIVDALSAFFSSARLATAIATVAIALGVFAFALHETIGWAGLIAMLSVTTTMAGASLYARRATIEWLAVAPLSLIIFVGWAVASITWSTYQWATLGGLAYLLAFTLLGIYIALVRDTIQIIRAFGDVLRFTLAVSLALEIVSGVLLDGPIEFLGIAGNLGSGGAISGVLGNRNELGLLAVIGGISFAIEWRTRSVDRTLAIASVVLAALVLGLTRSPIAWGTALVAVAALAALYVIRRVPPSKRTFWQFAILGAAAVAALIVWAFRSPIVSALNAGGELTFRLRLWQKVWALVPQHPLEGWGWIGEWHPDIVPFASFASGTRPNTSALNAYLDIWFQLGVVGIVAFVGLVGLAFVRSWLLAARQRSVIFTWPAVVLAALVTASLAESSILIEFGWLTFVVCCVKASQSLSWRTAFPRPLEAEPLV